VRKTFSVLFIFVVILFPVVLSSCASYISTPVLVDSDNDGVPDNYDYRNDFTKAPYYDKCPTSTPKGVKVDDWGCPLDADQDGVPDYLDKCPGTPTGVKVDKDGCPLDSDKDGVPDYLDKCPYTPAGVTVDQNGCPLDTDKDGVLDYLDKCPDTPPGVKVDQNGCPLDTDKDGVPDYLDKCPNTPPGVQVDQNGCSPSARVVLLPEEDGKVGELSVATAAGAQMLNKPWESTELVSPDQLPSAPRIMDEQEVKNIFKEALAAQPKPSVVHIIYFKSGSAALTGESLRSVQEILEAINSEKSNNIMVLGYTDTVASAGYNRKLSQQRAKSVADVLVSKGVGRAMIEVEYYGKEKLLVPTPDGVSEPKNRRVEIIVR
jgi:OOP family OmpA-OmpF porin